MAAPTNSIPSPRQKRPGRVHRFWERVTEGRELEQLWGQFLADAKASYGLYSREVDWDEINRSTRGVGKFWRGAWAVFQALLMKLTPARRVLLLIAIALIVLQPDIRWGAHGEASFRFGGIGILILFVLLALELADRVTMKRDLEIAREIQQNLVPDRAPAVPGFDIAFATRPQNTVAGDYYDAFVRPVSDSAKVQPLLVAVADVAGKSVPAALLMATFQASLSALAATNEPLETIVASLDRYARSHSLDGRRFTTAFLAEINPETREMRYTNAGHNNPILRRASGHVERLSIGGPPLGLPLFSENEFKFESATTKLVPGDLLFIFTDGVVEAVDDRGDEFGESRLMPCIESAPQEDAAATLQRVMTQVNTFVGEARQHDDITCLVLRVNP